MEVRVITLLYPQNIFVTIMRNNLFYRATLCENIVALSSGKTVVDKLKNLERITHFKSTELHTSFWIYTP